jgi:ABC-2 type transport system ATP-binding protein
MRTDGMKIIEFEDVSYRYGQKVAIANISLSVNAGVFFALLGPNGAGKTTAIRMMSTLVRPTMGSVRIGSHDVVKNAAAVRRQIGVVFQNNSLDDDLTVAENMHIHALIHSLERKDAAQRTDELLDLLGMGARKRQLVKRLSGGEKRRVEIARALLHRPKILYLDEPTVGLDTQVRHAMWQHLKQLSSTEGVTVVFTTHYLEEAEANADTVAVINSGRLLACNVIDAFRHTHGNLTDAYLHMTSGSAA